jgi:hypothetical protein
MIDTAWCVARQLAMSGPMFGTGWEEATMPYWMMGMSLEEFEDFYRRGVFSQDAFEAFMHLWATTPSRCESRWDSWRREPEDPVVQCMVSMLRQALAVRELELVRG